MYIRLVYLNIALVYPTEWRHEKNVDFSRAFRTRTRNGKANG